MYVANKSPSSNISKLIYMIIIKLYNTSLQEYTARYIQEQSLTDTKSLILAIDLTYLVQIVDSNFLLCLTEKLFIT